MSQSVFSPNFKTKKLNANKKKCLKDLDLGLLTCKSSNNDNKIKLLVQNLVRNQLKKRVFPKELIQVIQHHIPHNGFILISDGLKRHVELSQDAQFATKICFYLII